MELQLRTLSLFLTVLQVSEILQCTPSAVGKWIRQNKLRAVYAGRLVRICRSDLENFLRDGKGEREGE